MRRPPCLRQLGALLLLGLLAPAARAETIVVFRYDDYAGAGIRGETREDYARRLAVQRGVVETFCALDLSVTVAVYINADFDPATRAPRYPLAQDAEALRVLRQGLADGCVEPALHDYAPGIFEGLTSPPSFKGAPAELQETCLREGQEALELALRLKRPLDLFVAPRGLYDEQTVRCLGGGGFTLVSGGLGEVALEPLQYLPSTTSPPHMLEAVATAGRFPGLNAVVVMIHPFDFKEYTFAGEQSPLANTTVPGFGQQVGQLARMPGVRVLSMREVARSYPDLVSAEHLRAASEAYSLRFVPGIGESLFTLGGRSREVYWPQSWYRRVGLVRYLLYGVMALAGLMLGMMITGVGSLLLTWSLRRPASAAPLALLAALPAAAGVYLALRWAQGGGIQVALLAWLLCAFGVGMLLGLFLHAPPRPSPPPPG